MKKYLKYIMVLIIGLFIFNALEVNAESDICSNSKSTFKKMLGGSEYTVCQWSKVNDTSGTYGNVTISLSFDAKNGNWYFRIKGNDKKKVNITGTDSSQNLGTLMKKYNKGGSYTYSSDSFDCAKRITSLKIERKDFSFKMENSGKSNLTKNLLDDFKKEWTSSFIKKIEGTSCSDKNLSKIEGDITEKCNLTSDTLCPKNTSTGGLGGGTANNVHNEKCTSSVAPLTNNGVLKESQEKVAAAYKAKIKECGDCNQYKDKKEKKNCEKNKEELKEKAEVVESNTQKLEERVEEAEEVMENYDYKKVVIDEEDTTCEGILSKEGTEFLKKVLKFIQYGGVIVALLSSTLDLIKSVSSGSQEDLKKSFNRFLKRMIFAAILFFVVLLTNLLLGIFNITVPSDCV